MSDDPWADSDDNFGLFGDLALDEVPDDPFWIEEGYYTFIVTKAQWNKFETNDGSNRTLYSTEYTCTVDDPNSAFHGKPVQQRFSRYPTLRRSQLEEMDPKEKQDIFAAMSRHKQFLRGIGCSETDIASCGKDEAATIEAVQGRTFTAKYKVNKSNGPNGERTYRNLQNMKPVEDEPADSTSEMGNYEF